MFIKYIKKIYTKIQIDYIALLFKSVTKKNEYLGL